MKYQELLHKYNVPGPRYTSYPTVPYWQDAPTSDQWIEVLGQEFDSHPDGAALYIHIPFCAKLCSFCGCNMRVAKNKSVNQPYLDLVHKEWALYQKLLKRPMKFREIHLGGGTPTFLSPEDLHALMKPIFTDSTCTDDAELSIEIDPRVTTREHFVALKDLGFTRVSMGIQDFDPKVQAVINRVQPYEIVKETMDIARSMDFASVNFDLIYGLPLQTAASIEDTFEKVLQLKPDRIAYYGYAHVPWIKPEHRKFTEDDLPSGDVKRHLYELGREKLALGGYEDIGMDHFSTKTDGLWVAMQQGELHRNFMGYTAHHVSPLLALGVSAISDSWSMFVQNEKLLESYRLRLDADELPLTRGHILTKEDRVLRQHILNLMTKYTTSWNEEHSKAEFLAQVPARLQELERDGLVKTSASSVTVEPLGRAFIRNIAMAFDARLAAKAPDTKLFSKTI